MLHDLLVPKMCILPTVVTWLRSNYTASCITDNKPPCYVLYHTSRLVARGGGVCLLLTDNFSNMATLMVSS